MFKRVYVHNFRCLENFSLPIGDKASALLVGKNGAGKSTVSFALALLQKAARGANRVGELVKPTDFTRGRSTSPMRFEVDVELAGTLLQYNLALELPAGFKELRVLSETLHVDGQPVFTREQANITVHREQNAAAFRIDWHLIALPIIQEQSEDDPVAVLKRWLARSVIIAPIPQLITGESEGDTLESDRYVQGLGTWFTGLINHAPAAYAAIDAYLKDGVFSDFVGVKNPLIGAQTRGLRLQFGNGATSVELPFSDLSDGEKCFFISAVVLAANKVHGPLFCFWDEPESHLSLDEVGHFVIALRRSFENDGGQLLVTSHNGETIRHFSEDNTLVLQRQSHLEPPQVKTLAELGLKGDPVQALLLGGLTA